MELKEYLSERNSVMRLAADIGVAPSVVSQWKNCVRPVPADRCPAIERATHGAVRCEDVRPDVDWAVLRVSATVNAENAQNPESREAA